MMACGGNEWSNFSIKAEKVQAALKIIVNADYHFCNIPNCNVGQLTKLRD